MYYGKNCNSNQKWIKVNAVRIKTTSSKTVPTNINEENAACIIKDLYILLAFLIITIALLIAVKIYCYFKKHQGNQKHLLPYYDTNNEFLKKCYQ